MLRIDMAPISKITTLPPAGIRRQGGTVQVYANIPLLWLRLRLEAGETVTWKVVDRTHLLLVRLPNGTLTACPAVGARRRAGQESGHDGHPLTQDKLSLPNQIYLDYVA